MKVVLHGIDIVRTNIPVECLLNNFIDEDLQAAFAPLNLVDNILLNPRFSMVDGFITPIYKAGLIRPVIGAVLQVLFYIYRCFYFTSFFMQVSKGNIVIIIVLCKEFIYSVVSILIYIISIAHSNNFVLLMLKIQQAHRIINLDNQKILANHRFWNWLAVVGISTKCFMVSVAFTVLNTLLGRGVSSIILLFPVMIFDIGVIYMTRTVSLIGSLLRAWNHKITEYNRTHDVDREIHDEVNSTKRLLEAYVKLSEAFYLCRNVFQFGVLFQTAQALLFTLASVQSIIDLGSFNFDNSNIAVSVLTSVLFFVSNITNFGLLIGLGIACEQFYKQIRAADTTSVQVLNSTHDKDLRKTCKNVLRYNRATFRKLSVFGAFEVDAALPLNLLVVVITYTVVLLQFALLSP